MKRSLGMIVVAGLLFGVGALTEWARPICTLVVSVGIFVATLNGGGGNATGSDPAPSTRGG